TRPNPRPIIRGPHQIPFGTTGCSSLVGLTAGGRRIRTTGPSRVEYLCFDWFCRLEGCKKPVQKSPPLRGDQQFEPVFLRLRVSLTRLCPSGGCRTTGGPAGWPRAPSMTRYPGVPAGMTETVEGVASEAQVDLLYRP